MSQGSQSIDVLTTTTTDAGTWKASGPTTCSPALEETLAVAVAVPELSLVHSPAPAELANSWSPISTLGRWTQGRQRRWRRWRRQSCRRWPWRSWWRWLRCSSREEARGFQRQARRRDGGVHEIQKLKTFVLCIVCPYSFMLIDSEQKSFS